MSEVGWGLISIITLAIYVIWTVRRRPPIESRDTNVQMKGDGPISPDVYAWRNLFLLSILFFILSVALSVISWIYFGFLAGLGTLAACLFISFYLVDAVLDSSIFMKFVHWEFDRDKSRRSHR